MRRIHAAHHTACRVLLEKKFPEVFCQVWSFLFSIMPSRCVAAGCSNTKDGVSLHRFPSDPKYRCIWTTKVKLTRVKWSRPTEHTFLCSAHFEQTCFERGLHSQFSMAYKAMLLPDAIPMIFPLSKKAVKALTKVLLFSNNAQELGLIKHRVWFLYPGKTNIKTLNLSHYDCACFEFF